MGDDEQFEPTPEQRLWLDSLSPEKRHAVSDALHGQWSTFQRIAENLDNLVDQMLPHGRGEAVLNFHTNAALGAEAFRALARGDYEQANELFAAAEKYPLDPDKINITIAERPADE